MFKVVKTGKKTAKKGMPSLIFHSSFNLAKPLQYPQNSYMDIEMPTTALEDMFAPLMAFKGYRAAKQVSNHIS